MANLIDREALSTYLTVMIQVCKDMTGLFEISDKPEVKAEIKAYQAVLKDVQQFPPAQPEQRWIPCSERLPEQDRSVLVQLSDDFADPIQIMTLDISKCEGDFFCFWKTQEMSIDFDMEDVVAWMPLPEPYKEG